MNFLTSHPTKSYWNNPVLRSPAWTAPSYEAGRYLIIEQTHIRSCPAIWYQTTDFAAGGSGGWIWRSFIRTRLVKHRPPLHPASLSCDTVSLACESNHDGEHDLEALLARLYVLAKPLKGCPNHL